MPTARKTSRWLNIPLLCFSKLLASFGSLSICMMKHHLINLTAFNWIWAESLRTPQYWRVPAAAMQTQTITQFYRWCGVLWIFPIYSWGFTSCSLLFMVDSDIDTRTSGKVLFTWLAFVKRFLITMEMTLRSTIVVLRGRPGLFALLNLPVLFPLSGSTKL